MTGQRIESALWIAFITVVLAAAGMLMSGCMDPATAAALADMKKQTTLALQQAKDAGALAKAHATTQPTSHPIEWANLIEGEIAGPAKAMAWTCTLLALGGLGAWIASGFFVNLAVLLSTIGKLVLSICGAIGGGCWLVLFLLPWALWIIAATILLIVGVFLYFLSQAHWSIATLIGLHNQNAAAIETVGSASPVKPKVTYAGPAVAGSQSQPLVGQ